MGLTTGEGRGGLDVLSALTAGMLRRSDRDQFAYAAGQGRVLCSYNIGDFCRIHRDLMTAGGEHVGLILTQQHRFTLGEHVRYPVVAREEAAADSCAGHATHPGQL